jgi:hypothetical protein
MATEGSAVRDLARILVRAASPDRSEVHSVESLSEVAGVGRRVLQYRCQAVGVTARNCVHFVQCLRLVLQADSDWAPAALIPCSDPRTLRRIIQQGALPEDRRPALIEFLSQQQFIVNRLLTDAILIELTRDPPP